jgi:hypothetical protein
MLRHEHTKLRAALAEDRDREMKMCPPDWLPYSLRPALRPGTLGLTPNGKRHPSISDGFTLGEP